LHSHHDKTRGWQPFWAALGAALLVLLPLVGGTILLTRQSLRTKLAANPQSGVAVRMPKTENQLTLLVCTAGEQPSFANILAAWKPILYAGAMSSGVGYTLQIVGQKGMNPAVASLIMSLESVISVIAGWLILGQALSGREIFGCVLMFGAIVLAQLPERKKQSV